ncbi:unnamed protein product, partial [Mesorhabditis spiculigera]
MSMLRKPLTCLDVGSDDLDDLEKVLDRLTSEKMINSSLEGSMDTMSELNPKETPVLRAKTTMVTSTPVASTDFGSAQSTSFQATPIGNASSSQAPLAASSFRTPNMNIRSSNPATNT